MGRTYLYSETISVTSVETSLDLPALKKFSIINLGDNACEVNFDNPTSDTERKPFTCNQGIPYSFGAGYFKIYAKAGSGETASLQIVGERQLQE